MSRWTELKERSQALMERYGPIALGVHFALFFSVVFGAWLGIRMGLDLGSEAPAEGGLGGWLLATFGLELGLAYAVSQALKPVRLLLVLALTPMVARWTGYGAGDPEDAPES